MRFKPVPEPPDSLDGLDRACRAVPLVPEPEDDCCARLADRLEFPREEARTWLAFLRALGLVESGERGYHRVRDASRDPASLADAFERRVYGAREVLAALREADEPLDADEVAARAGLLPRWERERHGETDAKRRERAQRLLGWLALFGRVDRVDSGYRSA